MAGVPGPRISGRQVQDLAGVLGETMGHGSGSGSLRRLSLSLQNRNSHCLPVSRFLHRLLAIARTAVSICLGFIRTKRLRPKTAATFRSTSVVADSSFATRSPACYGELPVPPLFKKAACFLSIFLNSI